MEHGLLDAEGRLEEYVRDAFESLPPELRVAFRSLKLSRSPQGLQQAERLNAKGVGGCRRSAEAGGADMCSPQAHHA
jgi:hypothetical protein